MFISDKVSAEQQCKSCIKIHDLHCHTPECAGGWRGHYELDLDDLQRNIDPEGLEVEANHLKKYDEGKPMVFQMKKDFGKALLAVADVTTYGVEKYKQPGSWKEVTDAYPRYEDALGRHDLQMTYEQKDLESGRYHAVHRAWNALACLQLILEAEDEY